MEGYAVPDPAALAAAGLAELNGMMAQMVGGLTGPGPELTLDEIEQAAWVQGREIVRRSLQLVLDIQAAAEVRLPAVTGADGVRRACAERGHGRPVVTTLGEVTVRRIAYRSKQKGVPALYPRDAALNLPLREYSWRLQQLALMFTVAGAYEQAGKLVTAATGITIGKQQLEQITAEAAQDAPAFYPALARLEQGQQHEHQHQPEHEHEQEPVKEPGQDEPGELLLPLAISADGKGVAMRPEARRPRRGKKGQRAKTFAKRLGTGEKAGHKRMAQTGCVFDVQPPPEPRTPEQIMIPQPGGAPPGPKAVCRWYTVDIAEGREHAIGEIFAEADRRDPARRRAWIALVDGDAHQISVIQAQAAARGIPIVIIVDLIHVLEYLWKAAWCFCPPRDPAAEAWVTGQALDILHGRVTGVITRIGELAAAAPPTPGSEHAKNIKNVLSYLTAKQPYLDYPLALASGWPIATGVIEGACRHLVADRMGITGARWGLPGAQAILWLRAILASGDLHTYWTWHIQQEHQRNHLSRYKDDLQLAA